MLLSIYLLYPTIIYHVHKANSNNLPFISDYVHFVGREREVNDVLQLLSHQGTRIDNIYGSPGFGKSTLAVYVGHRVLTRGVNVHYVNLVDCPKEGVKHFLAEKIFEFANEREPVNFNNFLHWVRRRNFHDLILLDNCDEVLHNQKEELQYVVEKVIENSLHFKFLITSREVTSYVDYFEPYKLYELSKKAACDLLAYKIPSGIKANLSEREELAELTGSVPLALQIVGSLLRLPNLPSPTAVILKLKQEPILTLSPEQLPENKKINASFSLSYKYLSVKEKRIGKLLSNFPGSFTIEACAAIITFRSSSANKLSITKTTVTTLVQRSLLEYSHNDGRYHFHSLIRDYFLDKQKQSSPHQADAFFFNFQIYFFHLLSNASDAYNNQSFKKSLAILDRERHNFLQLLSDLETGAIKCDLKFAIDTITKAVQVRLLICRFPYKDMLHTFQHVMAHLEKELNNNLNSSEWKDTSLKLVYHIIDFQNKINSSQAAIDVFNKYKHLATDTGDPITLRIMSMVSEIFSNLGRHNDSILYHTQVIATLFKPKPSCYGGKCYYRLPCEGSECSYGFLGGYLRLTGEHDRAAYYLNLSIAVENHSSYERLTMLFQLHSVYIHLGQENDASNILEKILPILPDIIAMPDYELFQNMVQ